MNDITYRQGLRTKGFQDTIQLRITDTGVRTINVVVWYRNSI
jgi:hypothetical protein